MRNLSHLLHALQPGLRWLICVTLSAILTGCESVAYTWQAARGHFQLMIQARPVSEWLDDPALDPALRAHLELLAPARRFAADRLGLKVGNSYTRFARVPDRAVVWNLFVSPPHALRLKSWCFPIAGCVSYRGYFRREDAQKAAARFNHQDVWIAGASAYSTLGWFDDPLLSTMLGATPLDTVALLFHELAHRTLYVPGDTELNESWATFVEQQGSLIFAREYGLDTMLTQRQARMAARAAYTDLVSQLLTRLEVVYRGASPQEAIQNRAPLFRQFRQALHRCATRHPALEPWSRHGASPLNNARLLTVRTYHKWVPALAYQFRQTGSDWSELINWMQKLADQPAQARERTLQALNTLAIQSNTLTKTLEFRCQL